MERSDSSTVVVRPISRPHKGGVQTTPRENFGHVKTALLRRFEPESKHSLYAAEFQARCKLSSEDWSTFADDLKHLVDKALPDLDDNARE